MNWKKNLGVIFLICGLTILVFAFYIQYQVDKGKILVEKAQKAIKRSGGLFSLTPVTKELSDGLSSSAQKKIDEGSQEIQHYEGLAGYLKIGGIVVMILGVSVLLLNRRKHET